jgi:drug/metabolite transporter (DMT)-like permease
VPSGLDGAAGGWLLLAGAGNVFGLVLTYRALRTGQVALVAPLVSTEGAIAAVIALLAGETLAPSVGVTLTAIVVGIAMAAMPDDDDPVVAAKPAELPRREPRRESSTLLLAAGAAVSFGASLYATGRAGSSLPASWVVLSARLIGAVALALPLAATGRLALVRGAVPLVIASGLCEVAGFFSFTAGSRHGIAVAAVLSSQFAALSGLAAYALFGERLGRVQLAGVTVVVVGVAILSALRA